MIDILCGDTIGCKEESDNDDFHRSRHNDKRSISILPAGKGLTSWLSLVMSKCDVVTFSLVSWVRCDA